MFCENYAPKNPFNACEIATTMFVPATNVPIDVGIWEFTLLAFLNETEYSATTTQNSMAGKKRRFFSLKKFTGMFTVSFETNGRSGIES